MSKNNPLERGPDPKPKPRKPSNSAAKKKKIITVGVNRPKQSLNDQSSEVSPWLSPSDSPTPHPTASFVEYLRWMRSPDSTYKDPSKVQILQVAEEKADYSVWLGKMTQRTRLIAGAEHCFEVFCPWRIRTGGHRGPESILLPAFDAVGMPYLPSSTLRGVARTQAIREFMASDHCSWSDAEKKIAPWFGSIDEKGSDRAGKVVFLDAYPLTSSDALGGGIKADIATHIWEWQEEAPKYSEPNPNPFLSLYMPRFLIGLRLVSGCTATEYLEKVKAWLIAGLENGIGAQVNTGYGELLLKGSQRKERDDEFFKVAFSLEGQLVHGPQRFNHDFQRNSTPNIKDVYKTDREGELKRDGKGRLQANTIACSEIRPTAFKSMLRYWFRAFALGVVPSSSVQQLEGQVFGVISPQPQRGWLSVRIIDGRTVQQEARPIHSGKQDPCGEQSGQLILSHSSECPTQFHESVESLLKTLVWMMFHLGGIGQGARRPCYSRHNRARAPWWRGSTLFPNSNSTYWKLPNSVIGFQTLFNQRLDDFYLALETVSGSTINQRRPAAVGNVKLDQWTEAVDANCRIIVCTGNQDFGKPYALAQLHHAELKSRNRRGQLDYDGNLCGQVQGGVKPSPVWISDLEEYQVVTVFGATQDPRKLYVSNLMRRTARADVAQIWPFQ